MKKEKIVYVAFVIEERERYLVDPCPSLLGVYETEEEAEDAICTWVMEYYGCEDENIDEFSDCYYMEKCVMGKACL